MVIDCLSIDIIATAPSNNFLVNNGGRGIKKWPISRYKWRKMAKNDKKKQFSGKWQENGVVKDWSSSLPVDIILSAPADNIFVNKSGDGIKGSRLHWHKW